MEEAILFPPLPDVRDRVDELRRWNREMLESWWNRRPAFLRDYGTIVRWAQEENRSRANRTAKTHNPWSDQVMELTYSPSPGQPDKRLPLPQYVFRLVHPISEYFPTGGLRQCFDELNRLRAIAIDYNFNPASLVSDIEIALDELFSIPEKFESHLLTSLDSNGTVSPQTADGKTGNKMDGKSKGSSSKRGRRAAFPTEEDKKLADDWKAAKAKHSTKAEFARGRGIDQEVLEKALARVRTRKNRASSAN